MASSSDFKIKVKTQSGSFTLTTLNEESSVKELKENVCQELNMLPSDLKLVCGYPPKELLEEYDNCKFKEVDINSGDTILVVDKTNVKEQEPELAASAEPAFAASASSEPPHKFSMGDMSAIYEDIYSGGSIMLRHSVPSNNSCLFTSVYFLMYGDMNPEKSCDLRKLIAREVAANPDKYTSVFLGMENEDYCTWIQNSDHWGGAIELSILSDYYKVEIVAIDTLTSVMHRFGEDSDFDRRIFLIYDGIHYDPLVLESDDNSSSRKTIFDVRDEHVMDLVRELAEEAKSSRQFTDLSNFTLRCLVCSKSLRGEKEAKEHAKNTGHTNFGETNQ